MPGISYGDYMLVSDIKVGIDVAFNNCVTKIQKTSYDGAIDVQYGVYQNAPYSGCLTIDLKPSKQGIDWWYNFRGLPKSTDHGKVHRGYYKEIERYWPAIKREIILLVENYSIDLAKGIIVAGRSKGAGEALMMLPHLSELSTVLICAAIEPAKICDDSYSEYLDSFCHNIVTTSYRNDIVTGIPPWFRHTGFHVQDGKRTLGLSVKDHIKATTEEEIWYDYIKTL